MMFRFSRIRNIRHALMTGLNRQWMVDYLLQGQAVVADSPSCLLPGHIMMVLNISVLTLIRP